MMKQRRRAALNQQYVADSPLSFLQLPGVPPFALPSPFARRAPFGHILDAFWVHSQVQMEARQCHVKGASHVTLSGGYLGSILTPILIHFETLSCGGPSVGSR